MTCARSIHVRGVVQGVGFRPFVFRLARANDLAGWVLNQEDGVDIHLEGDEPAVYVFLTALEQPPPAARITAIQIRPSEPAGLEELTIRHNRSKGPPSVRISPDLPSAPIALTNSSIGRISAIDIRISIAPTAVRGTR
jgi:hydrogenase maturation protein HypF